jgi:hypothetical protein
MQLSPYEIALVAGGFTILGAILGSWLTFRFSLELSNINSIRLAGIRLRDAFSPELTKLQTSDALGITEIPDMLKFSFHKHQAAVNEFRFFLKGKQLDGFDKAWREYYYDPNEETPKFIQYTDELDPDHEIAIKRIQAILEFTKN